MAFGDIICVIQWEWMFYWIWSTLVVVNIFTEQKDEKTWDVLDGNIQLILLINKTVKRGPNILFKSIKPTMKQMQNIEGHLYNITSLAKTSTLINRPCILKWISEFFCRKSCLFFSIPSDWGFKLTFWTQYFTHNLLLNRELCWKPRWCHVCCHSSRL